MTDRSMSKGRGRVVAVYGAAGHTGGFVVEELLRRGMTPVAVGRDATKLTGWAQRGVEVRVAGIDDAASLERVFTGVDAVINCAGPFLDTAGPVAAAALRSGAHYLDVTAEQASATATYEAFDEEARRSGLIVMPAMGFYGGFADLLVSSLVGDRAQVDEIEVAIALDSWNPTEGTRRTGERNTFQRLVVADGALAPVASPSSAKDWTFQQHFGPQRVVELPFSEIVVIDRHLHSRSVRTWLGEIALNDIRNPDTPAPKATDSSGRSAQQFVVEAVVRRGDEEQRISARGRDIYAFTAPLVCEAVQRILAGEARTTGARAPGEVFDAHRFLDALEPDHLTLDG